MAFKLALAAGAAVVVNAQLDCTLTGYFYSPQNMYLTGKSLELNKEECMRRCNTTVYCEHYTYWPDSGCHLAGSNATLTKSVCGASNTNCSGLYAVVGPSSCADPATFPNPAAAVEGVPPPEVNTSVIPGSDEVPTPSIDIPPASTEQKEKKGFPIWAAIIGVLLLAALAAGIMYSMGFCDEEKKSKKKKKSKKASRDLEATPEVQPLVQQPMAVPSVVEPVPMYTSASPTAYVVQGGQSPTYAVQGAQPVYMVQQ